MKTIVNNNALLFYATYNVDHPAHRRAPARHQPPAIHPDLPNIDIQPESIGRTAAERLLWHLDNPKEPTQRLLIAPRLDVR